MAMMFRGLGKPTDQLDIQLAQASDPFGISTVGMGTSPYVPAPQDAAPTKDKFGFRDVIGILGEALGGALGQGPGAYTQGKLMERQMAQKSAAQQAQRQADWEDWVRQKQWERDNPAPTQGSEFERLLDAANLTPEQRLATVRSRVENTANPLQAVTVYNPDGSQGLQFIRPNQMGGEGKRGGQSSVGNSAPQGAIDYLRANPSAADQFDAKYGKGAAASILGGGGSNATGGFPR